MTAEGGDNSSVVNSFFQNTFKVLFQSMLFKAFLVFFVGCHEMVDEPIFEEVD